MKRHLVASVLLLFTASCAAQSTGDDAATTGAGSQSQARLDCGASRQTAVDLDVPGPGKSTPEQAVAPYADGSTTVVSQTDESATVNAPGTDGTITRVFEVTKRDGGWWPDSYRECAD